MRVLKTFLTLQLSSTSLKLTSNSCLLLLANFGHYQANGKAISANKRER